MVEELTVAYGRTVAVRSVDLRVADGQVVCLIGANGAGKTTIMRVLSGLMRPRGGRMLLDGTDIAGMRAHRVAARGLLQVPEGRQIFAELSVDENLTLGAWLTGDRAEIARRRDGVLSRFPRLRERARQVAGSMSGGEQQMLAIGRALMGNPRVLLLDEPSEGLAPKMVAEIGDVIGMLKREGLSIVLVEQNIKLALSLADDVAVVNTGRIAMQGPAAALAGDEDMISRHLGVF